MLRTNVTPHLNIEMWGTQICGSELLVEMILVDVLEDGWGEQGWLMGGAALDLLAKLGGADFKVEVGEDEETRLRSGGVAEEIALVVFRARSGERAGGDGWR